MTLVEGLPWECGMHHRRHEIYGDWPVTRVIRKGSTRHNLCKESDERIVDHCWGGLDIRSLPMEYLFRGLAIRPKR